MPYVRVCAKTKKQKIFLKFQFYLLSDTRLNPELPYLLSQLVQISQPEVAHKLPRAGDKNKINQFFFLILYGYTNSSFTPISLFACSITFFYTLAFIFGKCCKRVTNEADDKKMDLWWLSGIDSP